MDFILTILIAFTEPVEAPVPAVISIVTYDVKVIEINDFGDGRVQHIYWDTTYVKNDYNACHRLVLVNRGYRMGLDCPGEGITELIDGYSDTFESCGRIIVIRAPVLLMTVTKIDPEVSNRKHTRWIVP